MASQHEHYATWTPHSDGRLCVAIACMQYWECPFLSSFPEVFYCIAARSPGSLLLLYHELPRFPQRSRVMNRTIFITTVVIIVLGRPMVITSGDPPNAPTPSTTPGRHKSKTQSHTTTLQKRTQTALAPVYICMTPYRDQNDDGGPSTVFSISVLHQSGDALKALRHHNTF